MKFLILLFLLILVLVGVAIILKAISEVGSKLEHAVKDIENDRPY